jgi:DNA polymerase III epsilon subunit
VDNLLWKPIEEAAVVVLDTETTGLYPSLGHRVVEIGALRLEPGRHRSWQTVAEFSQLLQPDRRMEPGASRVNGITDAELRGQPRFSDIASQLIALMDGALIVAHNARFDASFLGMELHLWQPGQAAAMLPNPWLCTMLLARSFFYFGGNSLGHIARVLKVPVGRAHRALNDAHVTAAILKHLVRDLAEMELRLVGDLLDGQGGALYAMPPESAQLPPSFSTALAQQRPLRIIYAGPGGKTERVIEPLYTTSRAGVDYLIAYCRLRGDQRTFRVDRIVAVEIETG